MKINVEKKLRKIVNGHTEGFSTIELIMVIVIAGITMAIALPKFTAVTEVDLYSTARQVKSDIRYTQELAMSKYKKATITFTATGDGNMYTITGETPKYLPKRSKAKFNATGSGTTGLVYTFNSSGEPDPTDGAGDTLRISSSGGSFKDIEVETITGRATIQ